MTREWGQEVKASNEKAQPAKAEKATTPETEKVVSIFDEIVSGQRNAKIIYEDDQCLAFRDKKPVAKSHFLVIPKFRNGLTTISKAEDKHEKLLGHMMVVCAKVAKQEGLSGYRLVVNDETKGRKSIAHLHLHVIGGQPLAWPPGV